MDISLLIKMIRHLDNRITISCLAADLGISESTLNRCLTGKWSNSIKSSSVCYAVESYLNDYFDGDEQKFLDNIRSFCKTNNIPFDKYNELYSKEGLLPLFSEFYEEAYLNYRNSIVKTVSHPSSTIEVSESQQSDITCSSALTDEVKGITRLTIYLKINWLCLFVLFLGLMCAVMLMDSSSLDLFQIYLKFIDMPPFSFVIFILLLAVSKTVVGLTIDTVIAKRRYSKGTGKAVRSDELVYVVKYGGCHEYVPGEGRYALDKEHVIFSTLCNVSSGLISILMYRWVREISQHYDISGLPNINLWLWIILVISIIGTIIFNYFTQNYPIPNGNDIVQENSDTYRLDRLNVICDLAHLLFTQFFSYATFVFCISAITADAIPVSATTIMLVLVPNAFFWFISGSPYAIAIDSKCSGEKYIFSPVVFLIAFYVFLQSPKNANAIILLILALAILIFNICYFVLIKKKRITSKPKLNASSILAAVVILLIYIVACSV